MNRLTSLLIFSAFVCTLANPAYSDIELLRDDINVTREGNSLLVQLPFLQTSSQRLIDDLTVTLLEAESMQSLVKVRKKIVLLSGEKTEQVALPLSANTPSLEECVLRIDLSGHIWLKRFASADQELDLHIIGQSEWMAGSRTAMRVLVNDSLSGEPVSGAAIRLEIFTDEERAAVLAVGTSDESGSTDLTFRLRDNDAGNYILRVSAERGDIRNQVETGIMIQQSERVFLSTDKPVYQPGQMIHIRGLATHGASGIPLSARPLVLEVFDGKGNKVFKQSGETSEYGIFSADFQLADEVNQGEYELKAILNDTETIKSVQVYEYVLPKFSVSIKPERTFYQPGDVISGTIQSRYFFGRPLEGASVRVVGNAYDVGFNEFDESVGVTNAQGEFSFSLPIPERLVGQPMFEGNTMLQLDVRVTDTADHQEQKIHYVHVSVNPVEVELIPESGRLIPGVENEVFVAASYPDGSAAEAVVRIESPILQRTVTLNCDANGMASFRVIPPERTHTEFRVHSSVDGQTASQEVTLWAGETDEAILLRPDQALYRVGDEMNLTVVSPAHDNERAFLDIVRAGQTIHTRTLSMQSGKAEVSVPLDALMAGTLELHAYRVRSSGDMIRDTRRVVVLRNDDLKIHITPNQQRYSPGEPASVQIAVTGAQGEPVPSALGIHVVDESVYSLTENEPGLMKVFYAMERELLEPRVQIQGYQLDDVITLTAARMEEQPVMTHALFAKLGDPDSFSISIDSREEKLSRMQSDFRELQGALRGVTVRVTAKPQAIDEVLLRAGKSIPRVPVLDPWNRPYVIYGVEDQIWLASLGVDGQLNQEDKQRVPAFPNGFHSSMKGIETVFFTQPEDEFRVTGIQQVEKDTLERAGALRQARPAMMVQGGMAMRGADANPPRVMEQLRDLGYLGGSPGTVANVQDRGSGTTNRFDTGLDEDGDAVVNYYDISEQEAAPISDANGDRLGMISGEDAVGIGQDVADDLFARIEEQQGMNPTVEEPMIIGDLQSLKQAAEAYLSQELTAEMQASLKELTEQIAALQETVDPGSERAVRVRRYFPETLFYTPELITDSQGRTTLNLPGADSITTWRMTTVANAKSGALGDATAALQVFKPFFVDLNLPVYLTQDDEVTIPVSVYNYLDSAQDVEVSLDDAGWFELLDGDLTQTIRVEPDEVASVKYRIRANELGEQSLTVYAWGTDDADAMGRSIDVRPNGDARHVNHSGTLTSSIRETVTFPASRIEDADRLFVKVYPGVFSQVVEGLDSILKMPHGCFEQTSSTTYPNLLALQYMQKTDRITPAVELKATQYINLGYQRLLTFEIEGGGFSVFGDPPANRVLSAYGLMQFSDMSRVYPVDERVLVRTRDWLLSQRNADGTWSPDENYSHAEMWKSIQENPLLVTAYIAYALASSGETTSLQRSRLYLINHADEASDAYTLAILANALLALAPNDPATHQTLRRLLELGTESDDAMYWRSEASLSFARGEHAWVETTAWAAMALNESGQHNSQLGKTLNWLISRKDPRGTWGTTHGTVLALKALIRSLGSMTESMDATVVVSVDGTPVSEFSVTPDTSDVMRQVDLTEHLQANSTSIQLTVNHQGDSSGKLLYQVVGQYYVPWQLTGPLPDDFSIDVEYDRTELSVNDMVTCNVTAGNNRSQRAEMVMIDVGIPPGFRVEQSVLDDYVAADVIEKYTVMNRQLLIYLESLDGNAMLELSVPMRATLPLIATVPESTMYEYYHPETRSVATPTNITVE